MVFMQALAERRALNPNDENFLNLHGGAAASGWPGVGEISASFISSGRRLAATLSAPAAIADAIAAGEAPDKIRVRQGIITLHGWSGSRCGPHRILARICRRAAGEGAAALRFDLSGRGESAGAAAKLDLDAQIGDVLAAVNALKSRFELEEICLVGMCSGGNLALGAACATGAPEETGRCALISTLPFSARDAGMARRKKLALFKTYLRKALSPRNWLRLLRGEASVGKAATAMRSAGAEKAEDRRLKDSRRDIPAELAKRPHPCLFVYGGADPEAEAAEAYYRRLGESGGSGFQFVFVKGANHNYYAKAWSEEVEEAVIGFLRGGNGGRYWA